MTEVSQDVRHKRMEQFGFVLENILEVTLYRFDLQSGRCDYISPNIKSMGGYTIEESEFMDFEEIVAHVHPDDRSNFEDKYQRLLNSGNITAKYRFQCKDGNYRWFMNHANVFKDANGAPIYLTGVLQDVSESEQTLQESEDRFHAFMNNNATIAWMKDADGRYVYMSENYERFYGMRFADCQGKNDFELWPPEIAQAFWENDQAVLRNGHPLQVEEQSNRPDGSYCSWWNFKFPFYDRLGRGYIGGIGVDITKLKQAEEDIKESEDRWRTAVESAGIGAWDFHIDRNTFWHSRTFNQILGCVDSITRYTRENFFSYIIPEERAAVEDDFNRAISTHASFDARYRIRRNDGTVRWVWAHGHYRPGTTHQSARLFGLLQDITEEKEMMEALNQTDRNKDQFLAMLSHELRNPLAAIRNSLYILEHAKVEDAPTKRAYQIIRNQTDRLSRIVDDLLDMTRIKHNKIQMKFHRLDLGDFIRRITENYRAVFEKNGVILETQFKETEAYVSADEERLTQIVGNLLHNAAKFTDRGGKARVSVDIDSTTDQAFICISDTGVGMTPETVQHIFQPFMQVDMTIERSHGGLGLGLALVHELVTLHGGTVSAFSEGLGKGSIFTIRLPLDKTVPPEEKECVVNRSLQSRCVLIIEDNPDVAESMVELVRYLGHHVEWAKDGKEGITMAREYLPEVILCDIGLPGMNGYDIAETIRTDSQLHHTYLVALTGYALPGDLQQATNAGFDRHLAKPVGFKELEQTLASLDGRRTGS